MNVAYLLNTYPMTSTTFIRREIEALEELGVTVQRYVVRKWDVRLVDPQEILRSMEPVANGIDMYLQPIRNRLR